MNNKAKVKVIKKDDVKAAVTAAPAAVNKKSTPAREMVNTVTSWVSDFQQRKRDETKFAIEKLLSQHPRPSES